MIRRLVTLTPNRGSMVTMIGNRRGFSAESPNDLNQEEVEGIGALCLLTPLWPSVLEVLEVRIIGAKRIYADMPIVHIGPISTAIRLKLLRMAAAQNVSIAPNS